MWTNAYVTKNLQYFDNPYTPGQCGGMCAVWLANMHNRRNLRSLVATKPHSMAAIDTHLAGLRLAAPGSKVSVGVPTPPPAPPKEFRLKRKDLTKLPVEAANMRYVAAAGLKPGPLKKALRTNLGNWLAQVAASGGYFIDVGGHAVATFVNGKNFALDEKKRRLYYFDPNHGCFYSEDELSFNMKFNELVFEHIRFDEHTRTNVNRLFDEWWWSYFKVFDVSRNSDEDADIDISSLFNG